MQGDTQGQADPVRSAIYQILATRDPARVWSAVRLGRQVCAGHIYLRHCTRVGRLTRVSGHPRIFNHGSIIIGERVHIKATTVPVELAAINGGCIEIGDQTFLNYGVSISAHQLVRIGQRCLLGSYVNILDNNWHDIVDRSRTPPSKPVVLEDNVWLGNQVIVLPGVTIGHDAVVGAGAVVVRDVPPRSVAVGNPARVIRSF